MSQYVPTHGLHRDFGDLEFDDRYLGTYDPEDPTDRS